MKNEEKSAVNGGLNGRDPSSRSAVEIFKMDDVVASTAGKAEIDSRTVPKVTADFEKINIASKLKSLGHSSSEVQLSNFTSKPMGSRLSPGNALQAPMLNESRDVDEDDSECFSQPKYLIAQANTPEYSSLGSDLGSSSSESSSQFSECYSDVPFGYSPPLSSAMPHRLSPLASQSIRGSADARDSLQSRGVEKPDVLKVDAAKKGDVAVSPETQHRAKSSKKHGLYCMLFKSKHRDNDGSSDVSKGKGRSASHHDLGASLESPDKRSLFDDSRSTTPSVSVSMTALKNGESERTDSSTRRTSSVRRLLNLISFSHDHMTPEPESKQHTDKKEAALPKPPNFSDKYQFLDTLGKGGSSVVRLARRVSSDRKFAVKKFRWNRRKQTAHEFNKKVTAEFCIGSILHHENIVETVDIVHEGRDWYEVLEYCSGGDLFTMIKRGPIADHQIACFFKQLVDGVAYLHSIGVAHRDLKPENLLITGDNVLKITDFGISGVFQTCWESHAHKLKGLCGSAPYMAPEVFLDEEYDAKKVDVWACGIIFYAMEFGGVPWLVPRSTDPSYRYFLRRRDLNFEPFGRLPSECREFLRKVLNPNPARRPEIKDFAEDRWFKTLDYCPGCQTRKLHKERNRKAADNEVLA